MLTVTLHNSDCLTQMRDLPPGSIDVVIADIPYGTTACKWDVCIPFAQMWEGILRVTKPTSPIVLFGSQPFTSALVMSNPKLFRYEWIWDKRRPSNPMLAKKQALKVHENVLVFYRQLGTYNPQGVFETDGKPRGGVSPSKTELGFGKGLTSPYRQTLSGYPKSIQTFGSDNSKNVHPTQKPLALLEYLVRTYSNPGDTVLDFTMGSGTTGVACVNLNRNFVGIELDASYFKIAEARIHNASASLFSP